MVMLGTPNLPTNIVPTNISGLKLSGNFPMGLGIPTLKTKIMLESNPLKPTMLVGRQAVSLMIRIGYNRIIIGLPIIGN